MKAYLLALIAAAQVGTAASQVPSADGEVKRINTRTKEITIKHGPIPHLKMGPMTMAFPVKDEATLAKVKPGDKVTFTAEKVGDEALITKIEAKR